ncbi:MAG TPA: chemotaxis protein CheW [Methanospirillum sp.]|uniref:chemotaxis protein CheW n=1 Tax=Methanospirillum sp. TaxID=45200 RepID=UPI002BFD624C|nr:chemotaxis protein CheW [Methanospirillum sp.]HWQ63819.1 chemotaxis protein CheW [Methanospirillum sp.]
MTEEQEKNRSGRRALFTGAGTSPVRVDSIPVSEVEEAVRKINETQDCEPADIPEIFKPVITRLITQVNTINQQNSENADLQSKLLQKSQQISDLQSENVQLSSERESYLNDLITSHTEFDRALEIFQYHDVPMVLTGSENSLYDANNAFCTLFSIARSSITTSHPPLSTYFPDEPVITGPDGEAYSIVTLTPPVVPFDHEAISLVILVKTTRNPDPAAQGSTAEKGQQTQELVDELTEIPELPPVRNDSQNYALLAFEHFPLPAVVVDQYRTITACNQAFCSLVGRTKENVFLRDIGSCGIRNRDAEIIAEVLLAPEPCQVDAQVIHPDGTEETVFFGITPVGLSEEEPLLLLAGVPIPADQEQEPAETNGAIEAHSQGGDLMLKMLLDLNPAAAALLDEHARVIYANEGFTELTGISPADLTGTDVRDIGVTVPDSVLLKDATEVQFLPEVIRLETTWGVQENSGMVVPVGSSGSGVSVILILQPITKAEERSAPSQIQAIPPAATSLPAAISSPVVEIGPQTDSVRNNADANDLPIPVLQADMSGAIIKVNEAFTRMAGAGSELFIGQMRQKLMIFEPPGIVHATFPSGEFWFRETSWNQNGEETNQTFWYLDVTNEIIRINSLEKKIQALEGQIKTIKEEQGLSSSSNQLDSGEQIDIVEFELNEERYAIDITMVREVVEIQPITPLPRTPPYVIGIINLRGEVTHVIDLAILLGQRSRSDRSGQKIIIIPSDVTGGEHVGIIVDNVQSVTEIMGRHVSMLGDDITTQIKTHIKGIIKITHNDVLEKRSETSQETTLIIWLDIQKILRDIQGYS